MPFRALAAALFASLTGLAVAANHELTVEPIAAGVLPVACTNIEQDANLIASFGGTAPEDFWEGKPANGQLRYISQILRYPDTALRFQARTPDQRSLYPQFNDQFVDFVAIVCYPTPADNFDPGYVLPQTSSIVPHMQQAGQAPKIQPGRMPMILFSHGLGGSPISPGHLEALVELASHGYIVAAPFHGDARFSRIRIEDLGDFAYLLLNLDEVVEMELMRPLSLKAFADTMLAHPQFSQAIDADRIGAFGASLGGQAVLNLTGAKLTTSIGLSCHETARDPRVKAAVAIVPYAGQTFLPAFCDGQSGAEEVSVPFLGMSGTQDTTAPVGMARQAVNRMPASHYLVEMDIPHQYLTEYRGDIFTWTVAFLDAYLHVASDPDAMARLIRMQGVTGGPNDAITIDVHQPFAGVNAADEWYAVEFYNDQKQHYFIPAKQSEVSDLLDGRSGPGWDLTGLFFKVFERPPAASQVPSVVPVCRFSGTGASGASATHFFTANAAECDAVKRSAGWTYEGTAFYARSVQADGTCPAGWLAVQRAYNNNMGGSANHRFTTSDSTIREMQRLGWSIEGTVMCARP